MKDTKPRATYKKPKQNQKALFATLKIVMSGAVLAFFGILFYYAATEGWESVFAWFGGKYFCLVVIVLLLAVTAGVWLWTIVKKIKGLNADEQA